MERECQPAWRGQLIVFKEFVMWTLGCLRSCHLPERTSSQSRQLFCAHPCVGRFLVCDTWLACSDSVENTTAFRAIFFNFSFFYDLGGINKVQLEHAWERAREACWGLQGGPCGWSGRLASRGQCDGSELWRLKFVASVWSRMCGWRMFDLIPSQSRCRGFSWGVRWRSGFLGLVVANGSSENAEGRASMLQMWAAGVQVSLPGSLVGSAPPELANMECRSSR